jgi:hypothetical protein
MTKARELSDYTGLQGDLALKSPVASPVFTGNVGIGVVPEADIYSTYQTVQFGEAGALICQSGNNGAVFYGNNVVYNGSNSVTGGKYIESDEASALKMQQGKHEFLVAASGTADAAISWNTAMQINNAGIVTKPLQPSFLARMPSGAVAITSSAQAKFNFNSASWDTNNDFTGSNNRFTAPVAGKYFFQWLIQVENVTTAPNWYYAYPTVNGGQTYGGANGMTAADQVEPVNAYGAIKGTQTLNLNSGDYVELSYYWNVGNGNLKGGGESMWAGHLIG